MNLSGKSSRLAVLILALFYLGGTRIAAAQDDAPDEFTLDLPSGERRLDGKVRSISVDRETLVLDATSVSYPSGKLKVLDAPIQMVIAPRTTPSFTCAAAPSPAPV